MSADHRSPGDSPGESAFAIVGSGRLAQALGRLLADAGESVVAIGSRSRTHAERAARFIGASTQAVTIAEIAPLASRVLIAVSDTAIESVATELARHGLQTGVALHTSGANGPELLAPLRAAGVSCGVLHPLQTIATPHTGLTALRGASYGVAGDADAVAWAERIVQRAEGTVLRIAEGRFASYHAGAVMASNAVIAAVDAAVVLFGDAGVERSVALEALTPLCLRSARNALELGPETALTGPVERGDAQTIRAHVGALARAPRHVADLYRASSRALIEVSRRKGLGAADAAAIEAALGPAPDGAPSPANTR